MRTRHEAAVNAGNQGVGTQTIGAVIAVFTFSASEDPRNARRLLEIYPEPPHCVVHAGENLHGRVAWIVAYELLVDFKYSFKLAVERCAIDVGEIEIDHRLAIDPEAMLIDNLVDGASGHVAWHQISVLRIPLLEEVPALRFGNALRIALVAGGLWYPNAATFAARGLRHEPQLVISGNRGWMHLDKLAVRVVRALLIQRRLCRSGADNRVCRFSENGSDAARCDNYCVSREGADFH